MGDKDNRSGSDRAEGHKPFLVLVVQHVPLSQRERVSKNQFGRAKIKSMLCQVVAVLVIVPFKDHDFDVGSLS